MSFIDFGLGFLEYFIFFFICCKACNLISEEEFIDVYIIVVVHLKASLRGIKKHFVGEFLGKGSICSKRYYAR